MSATLSGAAERPLVAVVCAVPLVFEGLREALDQVARVQFFPAARGTSGLLRWVKPDAVVVDDETEAEDASVLAREHDLPLVYVSIRDQQVQVFRNGVWSKAADGEASATPEVVRDVVAGSLYGRRHA